MIFCGFWVTVPESCRWRPALTCGYHLGRDTDRPIELCPSISTIHRSPVHPNLVTSDSVVGTVVVVPIWSCRLWKRACILRLPHLTWEWYAKRSRCWWTALEVSTTHVYMVDQLACSSLSYGRNHTARRQLNSFGYRCRCMAANTRHIVSLPTISRKCTEIFSESLRSVGYGAMSYLNSVSESLRGCAQVCQTRNILVIIRTSFRILSYTAFCGRNNQTQSWTVPSGVSSQHLWLYIEHYRSLQYCYNV